MKYIPAIKQKVKKILHLSRKGASTNPLGLGNDLNIRAHQTGDIFKKAAYFDQAEGDMEGQWNSLIWPMIKNLDFDCVIDLAAGHGRNTAFLRQIAQKVIVVDINQECIDYCKNRFGDDPKIAYLKNTGYSLAGIPDRSVTLIYSFDSMVHFDNEVVKEYTAEFARVLKPGGHGFIHHSNYTGNPGGNFLENPHCRNFMSKDLFAHYLIRSGLRVVSQTEMDWLVPKLDCLTLFSRP